MIPEIVTTFTLQVDAAKKLKCDQLHTVVSIAVSIGIQLAQQVLAGFLAPELGVLSLSARIAMQELESLEKAAAAAVEESVVQSLQAQMAELKKTIEQGMVSVGKMSWMTTLGPIDERVIETNTPRNFGWSNVLLYNFGMLEGMAYTDLKKVYNFNNQFIGPGISHGTICSEFEGDFNDNNAGNRDGLAGRLSSVFESGRRSRQAMFKALYQGYVANPGEPSGTAMWLKTRDWMGPGSVMEDMRDISKIEE
jgi:hypothetical protein